MLRRIKGPKGLLVGAGALVALAGAFLLGSATLGGVLAQNSGDDDQGCTAGPTYTSSIRVADRESGRSEADEAKDLAKLATVTPEQARSAALAQFPGGKIREVQLENERGSVVYSVEVTDTAGVTHDVKVDAGNATVLHVEQESNDGDGGDCD